MVTPMMTLNYKGFTTEMSYSPADRLYYGKLEGIKDLVDYSAATPQEAELEFQKAVDAYLAMRETGANTKSTNKTMRVIRYEVGYDISEILGSGTTYYPVWKGNSEEDAFNEFNKPYMTYLMRVIKDDGRLRTQFYDRYTKQWS